MFMHCSKAEARVGKDLHALYQFVLESPISYPAPEVPLLAKVWRRVGMQSRARKSSGKTQFPIPRHPIFGLFPYAQDVESYFENDKNSEDAISHPDHANGEQGMISVFSLGILIFAASVEKVPNPGFGNLMLLALFTAIIPGAMRATSGGHWFGENGLEA